jgi:hypothetical protein
MKRLYLSTVIITMIFVFSVSTAHAVGFGFYGSGGKGTAEWDDDDSSLPPKFTTDSEHRAFGITLDTGLSGRRFFNYHLNIGRETFMSKNFLARDGGSTLATGDLELEGMIVSHTFGFGGELSDNVRMWLGPEIRWHFVEGTLDNAPDFQVEGAGFGFGPSMGLNFNFPSGLTLMIKAGYIMSNYSLDGEGSTNGINYIYTDFDVDEKFTYVNFEILFRSPGDR